VTYQTKFAYLIDNIRNYDQHVHTAAKTVELGYASWLVGINRITRRNYYEFYLRYNAALLAQGEETATPNGVVRCDLGDIEEFIGFATNAPTLTDAKFRRALSDTLFQRAKAMGENL